MSSNVPAKIQIPSGAQYILKRLHELGFSAYVVGGCVRDSLMGKTPKDWDICTSASPAQVKLNFYMDKQIDAGLKHGTVTLVIDGEAYEVTTFRTDGEYADNRHPSSVTFVQDVRDDLSRRDFTVNAMAYNDTEGLVDPYNGSDDISNKLIRCVGDPDTRFREDGLRILRALRFASTYGFSIHPDTASAIDRNVALLENISSERIRDELCKLLCGQNALNVLTDFNDIISFIIPALKPCVGFQQNSRWHIYDVYDHIAHAVAAYTGDDMTVKLALLLHDIGKPFCYTEDENGGHFHGHGPVSRDVAMEPLSRLRLDNRTKHDVLELILFHDSTIETSEKAVRRWLNRIGPEQFHRLMEVRRADELAQTPKNREERLAKCDALEQYAREILEQKQCFSLKDLAINGMDLLSIGIPEGKMMGKILRKLLDGVLNEEYPNEKETLLGQAKKYIEETEGSIQ